MNHASIHGPWPPFAEQDYPATRLQAANSSALAPCPPALEDVTVPSAASLRLRLILILHRHDGLTLHELSALADLSVSLVRPQFQFLRNLNLVEQGGTRRTPSGMQGVFRLNPQHPSMEFILGPAPRALQSPQEIRERAADFAARNQRRRHPRGDSSARPAGWTQRLLGWERRPSC